jgi:hypothetical protein
MRGRLPDAVLARKKRLWFMADADASASHGLPELSSDDRLRHYVDVRMLPPALPGGPALERLIAVHALDCWLGQRPRAGIARTSSPL